MAMLVITRGLNPTKNPMKNPRPTPLSWPSLLVILSQVDLLGSPEGGLVFLVELPDGRELQGEHHLTAMTCLEIVKLPNMAKHLSLLRCFNVEARVDGNVSTTCLQNVANEAGQSAGTRGFRLNFHYTSYQMLCLQQCNIHIYIIIQYYTYIYIYMPWRIHPQLIHSSTRRWPSQSI